MPENGPTLPGKSAGLGSSPRRSRAEIDALVVDQLARASRPISAYDIASSACSAGQRLVPNQVYRTLDRLIERGTVRRVELLGAYVLCCGKADAFLVCDDCRGVQALPAGKTIDGLHACARTHGFNAQRFIVEIRGTCRVCARSR